MLDFIKWCEERKFDLNSIVETPGKETPTTEGSTKRAAVRSHAYPPAYGRGQYTKGYFNPTAADNLVYNKDKE